MRFTLRVHACANWYSITSHGMSVGAGGDAFLLESLFRNEAWGHMLAPISEANERAVYLSMTEGCRAALQVCDVSTRHVQLCFRTLQHAHSVLEGTASPLRRD